MADINKLKVTELKEELKKRGLGTTGLKKDLVERLEAAIASDAGGQAPAAESAPEPAPTSEPAPVVTETAPAPEPAVEESAPAAEAAPAEAEAPSSPPEAELKPAEHPLSAPTAEPTAVPEPAKMEEPAKADPAPPSPASVGMDVEDEPAPLSTKEASTSVPVSALSLPSNSMEVDPSALAPTSSTSLPSTDPSAGPPSSTLYITGLRRPLQARSLSQYLNSFPPSNPDDEYDPPPIPGTSPFVTPSVPNLWLSGIKDHAYYRCWSIAAASAIKAGADGRKWPQDEPNAGTLHVRFVPDGQVGGLVEEEEAGWRNGRQRYELVDKEDGGVGLEIVGKQSNAPPPPAPAGAARGLLGRMGERMGQGGPGGLGRQAPRAGVNALPVRGRGGAMRYTRARPSLAWTPGPRAGPRA